MTNGFVIRKNSQIYYEVEGTGIPIVYLHGNGEDLNVFKNQRLFFKDQYRQVFIDTRGNGKSLTSDQKLDFDILADDVFEVLRNLQITKAYFVGFSDGANTLFHIAKKRSDVIIKGVAISGNLFPKGLKTWAFLGIYFQYLLYAFGSLFNKKYLSKKRDYHLMVFLPKMKFSDFENINTKILVLAGKADIVKESHTQMISKYGQFSLKIIAGDHFVVFKEFAKVNQIILEYFSDYN